MMEFQLNPNHSHYLCVDNGEVGRFGVELNFRVELETFMSCFDHNARRMGIAELTQHFTACTYSGGNAYITKATIST